MTESPASQSGRRYARHYEETDRLPAPAADVFAHIDDHRRLSAHMGQSSWMMAGGQMALSLDDGEGRSVGSHIGMSGRVLGISLQLDEVVTIRVPPSEKVWETVGAPRLLVIGEYRMGFEVVAVGAAESQLRVYIDYNLPAQRRWLGSLFGRMYAVWCVRQMLRATRDAFAAGSR